MSIHYTCSGINTEQQRKTNNWKYLIYFFCSTVTIILIISENFAHDSSQILLHILLVSVPSVDIAFLPSLGASKILSDCQLLETDSWKLQNTMQGTRIVKCTVYWISPF